MPAGELVVRAGDGPGDVGRTVCGIAVPFGAAVDAPEGREAFAHGAFARTIAHAKFSKIKLCVSHRRADPVGVCALLEERSEGLYGEFRVSATAAGDDVIEQVRDGTLDELSIGFFPQRGRREGKTFVHTEVRPIEVSLVPWGVYGPAGALVTSVRSVDLDEPELVAVGTPRLDALGEILATFGARS
jgi:HK97 family phage prohead protease